MSGDLPEIAPAKRWHRIRFYEGTWSNFDEIMPCGRPGYCSGCQYKHEFCTEQGRVIKELDHDR